MIATKKEKWDVIASRFNKKFNSSRTAEQLIQKWRTLKKGAKKASAMQRKEIFKTGGGVSEAPPITQHENIVLGMIQEQIKPLSNPFDSDKKADVLEVSADIKELPQDHKVARIKTENAPKKSKMAESECSLLEMKRVEHELRIAHMKEEHELKLSQMREEHQARLKMYEYTVYNTRSIAQGTVSSSEVTTALPDYDNIIAKDFNSFNAFNQY